MAEIFQSNFVLGLQGNLYQDFVNQVARPIIQDIVGTDDYKIIDFDKHLSSLDFNQSKRKDSIFPEFYLNFLGDIVKDDDSVSFKKKVCITLDERLCTDICQNTGRKITAIKLAGVELAYFIYFDVKEFFDFVYGTKSQEYKTQTVINNTSKLSNQADNKPSNNKTQKIETTKENNTYKLNENISQKLSSQKKDNDNSNIIDYIEKIGYVHSKEEGFSRIREITTNEIISFIIPHCKEFPKAKDLPIGTIIKTFGIFNFGKFRVEKYEEINTDELPFKLMKVKGTFKFYENSPFTIIRTNIGSVSISIDLVKDYKPNVEHQVNCIMIESYNTTKREKEWLVIHIYK